MKKLIAANWKMNKTLTEALSFCSALKKKVPKNVDVLIFPPYPLLSSAAAALKGAVIGVGAQDMHQEENGAYTGEVSASMILSVGCTYVLLGHSERRTLFFEDDTLINKKVLRALDCGLRVVFCIGETLKEREMGKTEPVLARQLSKGLLNVTAKQMGSITIAYEPVWAIGTGKTATPKEAQEAHAFIRKEVAGLYSSAVAKKTRILYGGSVTPENSSSLFSQKDVDGGLIGGASLDLEKFLKIIDSA